MGHAHSVKSQQLWTQKHVLAVVRIRLWQRAERDVGNVECADEGCLAIAARCEDFVLSLDGPLVRSI